MNRLNRLTAEARERCVGARTERERRGDGVPGTGDVFRLDETADLAVLWALAEHDEERRRFLAVAADLDPLVAGSDVAVPPESRCGSLSLRCGVEVWLDEADLEGADRVGTLDGGVVEQVRRKRAEIAAGNVAGSLFARETEVDPEYRDWMEEGPQKAKARLLRRPEPGRLLEFPEPERDHFFGLPARMAASILLVVTLGLLAGLVWQSREPGRPAEELVHLPFAVLVAGQVRTEVQTLVVPGSASSFLLLVETNTPYPAYRLEIREKEGGGLVWASSGLEPTKERRGRFEAVLLPVVLPRRILGAGEYRVSLFGLRNGRTEALEEHLLRVRME